MNASLVSPHPAVAEVAPNVRPGLSLFRLYTLRLAYLILAAGLGAMIWPAVISHSPAFALAHGIQAALLAAIGLTAVLGLRYPVQMLPLLIFEFTWKRFFCCLRAASGAPIRSHPPPPPTSRQSSWL